MTAQNLSLTAAHFRKQTLHICILIHKKELLADTCGRICRAPKSLRRVCCSVLQGPRRASVLQCVAGAPKSLRRALRICRAPKSLLPRASSICKQFLLIFSPFAVQDAHIPNICYKNTSFEEPYISTKEPYISTKEPYISAKEPQVSANNFC